MLRMLPSATRERLQTVWDELADFEIADTDAAIVHAIREIGAVVQASSGTWCGALRQPAARRDPHGGWRVTARIRTAFAVEPEGLAAEALRATSKSRVCAARLSGGAIAVAFRVGPSAGSVFVWRPAPGVRFTAADGRLLCFALRGLKWFHRRCLCANNLCPASRPAD